jgi:hypothetical protein
MKRILGRSKSLKDIQSQSLAAAGQSQRTLDTSPSPSANVIILREVERRGQLAVELDFERAAFS